MRLSSDAFALGEGPTRLGIISHGLSYRCDELCLFEALYPAPLARPFSKGLRTGDYLTWTFIPLRRIVPLRGTLSCAFGAALLQGPTRGGLSHMGFHAAATNCASSRHSILRLWRGPSPRAYTQGLSHIGFHAAATNCASSRTLSCAFGAALLQGPTRGGLSHMDFYTAAASCAYSRRSILRLWRGPSPRAYTREEYSSP